jgi:prefoldin subunit 5
MSDGQLVPLLEARLDAYERHMQSLEQRLGVLEANNARILTLMERLTKAQASIVVEIKDKVSEIRASLPQTPMIINQ